MAKKDVPVEVSEYFRAIGARGGAKGGRWKDTTSEERSQYMRDLAAKRKHPGRKRGTTPPGPAESR